MPILPEMLAHLDELAAIRRDIHAHPEIGFEERRTSELVAQKLAGWGCRGASRARDDRRCRHVWRGNSRRAIGLRADMDCCRCGANGSRPLDPRPDARLWP